MVSQFFPGVEGTYTVVVEGAAVPIDMHELWIEGVGHHLRSSGEAHLFAKYRAARFSLLSPGGCGCASKGIVVSVAYTSRLHLQLPPPDLGPPISTPHVQLPGA